MRITGLNILGASINERMVLKAPDTSYIEELMNELGDASDIADVVFVLEEAPGLDGECDVEAHEDYSEYKYLVVIDDKDVYVCKDIAALDNAGKEGNWDSFWSMLNRPVDVQMKDGKVFPAEWIYSENGKIVVAFPG